MGSKNTECSNLNKSVSFSREIEPITARMSRQGVFIEKIKSVIQKPFKKHEEDLTNAC